MTNIIATDVQGTEVNTGIVELYELYLSNSDNDDPFCFHAGVDYSLRELQFYNARNPNKVNIYTPIPVKMEGLNIASDGASSRPTITIANVEQVFTSTIESATGKYLRFRDLVGLKLVKRQTLEKYLIGQPSTSNVEFPIQSYYIDRVKEETNTEIQFELAAPYDLENIQIPARVIIGKFCPWIYQGHALDRVGGCYWPANNEKIGAAGSIPIFLNVYDEPLIELAALTSVSAFSANTTYAIDSIVTFNGDYYRAETLAVGGTPDDNRGFWQIIRTWTLWEDEQSYNAGDYVRYGNNIWRCSTSHESSLAEGRIPTTNSRWWSREDYCGKTLKSCKARFQASATANGVVSARRNTTVKLPFGAFPGSAKFS